MNQTILRRPDVEDQTGLPRSTIYFMVAKGTFPKPIKIGERSVGWLANDVADWINNQIQASRGGES